MNTIKICKKLKEATRKIIIHDGVEIIGIGSGVIINNKGDILTAAHVVTTRLPVRKEDVQDPEIEILVMHEGIGVFKYYSSHCGITFVSEFIKEPISIDLAVIRPYSPMTDTPSISINVNTLALGTKILMAGFSDEIAFPFSFDKKLNYKHPYLRQLPSAMQKAHPILKKFFDIAKMSLMIKSGMIGNILHFNFKDPSINYSGDILYIDNVMHSGASGGPVVNENCELVGIISERAIAEVSFEESPGLKVPSGSAVAITPKPFANIIKEL